MIEKVYQIRCVKCRGCLPGALFTTRKEAKHAAFAMGWTRLGEDPRVICPDCRTAIVAPQSPSQEAALAEVADVARGWASLVPVDASGAAAYARAGHRLLRILREHHIITEET